MSSATQSDQETYRAVHRYARITARKARLIADQIRGRSANEALELLEFAPQRAAAFYRKVVQSAVANAATRDESVNVNRLVIVDARADDGPMLQNRLRWRPGPQGRAMPFAKKTSHLTVVVAQPEKEPEPAARGARRAAPEPPPRATSEAPPGNEPDAASGAEAGDQEGP